MIYKFINDICNTLNIPVPEVSFDTSNFATETTLAQCKSDGTIIYLKEYEKPNPDQFFAVAHELRHVWQMINDNEFYFSEYKTIETCSTNEEYNLQGAEIDANAFAGIVMIIFFHLKPLFKGLSDKVKEEIYRRMDYIKTTL